jgi:predicted nucleotidyltransferase
MAGSTLASLLGPLASALEKRPDVLEAYLFGSHAHEATTPLSDVDAAVYVEPALAPASAYGYAAELSASLGSATGRRDIDVVVLNTAPPLLYHRVITGGLRVFSRDLRRTTTREGQALSRYCDYLPQLRRIDAALGARLSAGTFGR